MTYAAQTSVSVERSKAEIESTVARYGASRFFSAWDESAALVGFQMEGRTVQFRLPLPDKEDFATTPGGRRRRNAEGKHNAWEQAQRARWRALLLCIKAKLESVESGIETFEEAFLAHILVVDNEGRQMTVGERMIPQIGELYAGGKPRLELTA